MRARRRKDEEMKNVKRKFNEENFLPNEVVKLDPDDNLNEKKLQQSVRLQGEREKMLYPLRIDNHTVILVPKHQLNNDFKQAWLAKTGKTKRQLDKEADTGQDKAQSATTDRDLLKSIKSLMSEGYTIVEIASRLFLSKNRVRGLVSANRLKVLSSAERARIFRQKGLSLDEICERMGIKMSTLKRML